jgi:flagellar motor switch/type III secretory pathway protein FliN
MVRKAHSSEEEHVRMLRLIQPATLHLDARLHGPTLGVQAVLDLKEDDILALDYPVTRPIDLTVNGKIKYEGEVVGTGLKRGVQITRLK